MYWIIGSLNVADSCVFLWLIFLGLIIILHENESWAMDVCIKGGNVRKNKKNKLEFVEYFSSVHDLTENFFVISGNFCEKKFP